MLGSSLPHGTEEGLLVRGVVENVDRRLVVKLWAWPIEPRHHPSISPGPPEYRHQARHDLRAARRLCMHLSPALVLTSRNAHEVSQLRLTNARKPLLKLLHNGGDVLLTTLDVAVEGIAGLRHNMHYRALETESQASTGFRAEACGT
jgi:hypothetical protein